MKKLNGVIMAAGMGTRLLPKTKNKPKGMLVVNRETLIARPPIQKGYFCRSRES